MVIRKFISTFLILGLSALTAQADSLPALPVDAGPSSIEVSRRAVRAWMQDWIDDSVQISGELNRTCTISKLELAGFFLPAPMADIRERLQRVFQHGRRVESSRRLEPFLIPFTTSLSDIAAAVALTSAEQVQMRLLQARLDRIEQDSLAFMTDRLRVIIDTEWFITLVSKRLYDEEIVKHVEAANGFWRTAFKNEAFCQAYRIRKMRNQELTRSGQAILNTYLLLKQALRED